MPWFKWNNLAVIGRTGDDQHLVVTLMTNLNLHYNSRKMGINLATNFFTFSLSRSGRKQHTCTAGDRGSGESPLLIKYHIVSSKIDENRCKQTLASLP